MTHGTTAAAAPARTTAAATPSCYRAADSTILPAPASAVETVLPLHLTGGAT